MTDETASMLAIAIAVVCGGMAGWPFAMEGENRRVSMLAAAYCGAGAGLLGAPLITFGLILVARLIDGTTGTVTALARAGEAVGPALLWGPAAGAGGGLTVGIVVVLFCKSYAPRGQ